MCKRKCLPSRLVLALICILLVNAIKSQNTEDSLKTVLLLEDLSVQKRADVYIELGYYYEEKMKYHDALQQYYKALTYYKKIKNPLDIGRVKIAIGNIFGYTFNYEISTKLYFEALAEFSSIKDSFDISTSLGNIGINYLETGDHKRAKQYFSQSLHFVNEKKILHFHDSSGYAQGLVNYAITYLKLGDGDSAMKLLEKAEIHAPNGDADLQTLISINRADAYFELGKIISAKKIYQKVFDKLFSDPNPVFTTPCLLGLANVNFAENKDLEGITFARLALKNALEQENVLDQTEIYQTMYKFYLKKERFDSAYHYHRLTLTTESKRMDPEMLRGVNNHISVYEMNKINQQAATTILLLKKETEAKNWFWFCLLGVTTCITIVIFVFIYRFKSKRKITQLLMESQLMENRRLEGRKDFKIKRLTNLALYIAEKNQFIKEFNNNLNKLKSKYNNFHAFIHIDRLILEHSNQNEEISTLEEQIAIQGKKFFERLNEKFPTLTLKDKKLCSMLVLNLSSKEIASVMDIQIGSVEKSRHRLRQKLGLGTDENLTNFLNKI